MDAQDLHPFAAIGAPAAAGDTFSAIEVWLHRTVVANRKPQPFRLRPKFNNLNAKLMAQDARIGKKGLPAAKGMQVSATDANPPDTHQYFSRSGRGGF
jgi:hypothetical protein